MISVRPISDVSVVDASPERAEALVEEVSKLGVTATLGAPGDVLEAEIICTCTSSPDPVFSAADLPARVHINAIGSHHPNARELDTETVRGSTVWVEDRDVAAIEAGDLIMAGIDVSTVGDLHELCTVGTSGRPASQRSVYKGVGLGGEDLVIAAEVYRRWSEHT